MSVTPDTLLQQALALPDDSKLLLAEQLVARVNESTDGDRGDAELVERRRAEFLAGTAEPIPVEDALQQVRRELSALRAR